uniref:At2g35280-like TPR domain-containing protein n=1 Tax=Oryza nivara TaxID=4536 RepID=A0A0E0G9D4_ORYNI
MVSTRSMAARAKAKQMNRPSATSATMKELALCHDNVVHIACLVAATSPEPIADLLSLRATCKAMHAAAKERDVGKCVPLERLDNMKWMENERYLAIVNHLVGAGNPDACFITGVTLVFAHQDMEQGLLFLNKAATAGHKAAAYVLGLLLYKFDDARATGKKYISQVEDDGNEASTGVGVKRTNRECQQYRKIVGDVIQEATWKVGGRRGRMLVLPEDSHHCTATGCGVESGWEGYGVFCSDDCRIKHEYSKFFTEAKQMKRPSMASATTKELALRHGNIVHIACLVAATSSEPITDLLSLCATCKAMHVVAKECDVGSYVPLERLDNMKWIENKRYFIVVNHLVTADNLDACFIVGVTLVFTHQDMEQGLLFLDKAAITGHKAVYVLGLLLHGDGEEAATGVGVKRTNQECQQYRKIAEDMIQEATWKVKG